MVYVTDGPFSEVAFIISYYKFILGKPSVVNVRNTNHLVSLRELQIPLLEAWAWVDLQLKICVC